MAEKTLEEMREAVEEIRAKMAAAAREAGRDPAAVQLCVLHWSKQLECFFHLLNALGKSHWCHICQFWVCQLVFIHVYRWR